MLKSPIRFYNEDLDIPVTEEELDVGPLVGDVRAGGDPGRGGRHPLCRPSPSLQWLQMDFHPSLGPHSLPSLSYLVRLPPRLLSSLLSEFISIQQQKTNRLFIQISLRLMFVK